MDRRKEYTAFNCAGGCGKKVEFPPWQARKVPNGIYRCKACTSSVRWTNLSNEQKDHILAKQQAGQKAWRDENQDQLSDRGKKARAAVKISGAEMRKRQQDSIEADPELYAAYKAKRRKIALDYHASLDDAQKAEHYAKVFKDGGRSAAEVEFFARLREVGLHFEEGQTLSGFFPDGIDQRSKVIVEFFGDVFHCNPAKFSDPDQYCSWISRTVGEQWKRDERRKAVFTKSGFHVITVWQSDWIKDPETVIKRILSVIKR
jgi:very-short-patch-repair endonuclease